MTENESQFLKLRKSINRARKKFHDTVTNYNLVRISTFLLVPGYLGMLIIAVIIAYMFGGETLGPGEFYMWTNTLSDLAGVNFSKAPYLYDIAAILCGILTIPLWFYLEKILVPMPKKPEDYNKITRLRYRMGSYALLFAFIGSIGYIGVGVFSIDRNYLNLMHTICAALAFGGFIIGAFFYSSIILLYETRIPKSIGLYGIFGPLSFVVLTILLISINPEFSYICEWLVLFSIVAWMIGLAFIIIFKTDWNR